MVIYHPISSKFHKWITLIKLLAKFENGFCPMNTNEDDHQKGYRLNCKSCGYSTLVIYHPGPMQVGPKIIVQGSSWALTVGGSDFSLQENKGEVTVR